MSGTLMIAQIQLVGVNDPEHARIKILERKPEIEKQCNECDPILVNLGGGFRDLEVRVLKTQSGTMVITHLIVDTRDAMGANAVNTMAEAIAPRISAVLLSFISSLPSLNKRSTICQSLPIT
jgi:hydroxymethylglutaryl-CoA reductase